MYLFVSSSCIRTFKYEQMLIFGVVFSFAKTTINIRQGMAHTHAHTHLA